VPAQKWRKTVDFMNSKPTYTCSSTKNGTLSDKICQCRTAIFVIHGLDQQKVAHQIENGELTLPVLAFDQQIVRITAWPSADAPFPTGSW
jgi:hypothetical protein